MLSKRKWLFAIFIGLQIVSYGLSAENADAPVSPQQEIRIRMLTNQGEIILGLYPQQAPITVENFLSYIRQDFYTGTIFHRIIDGFMIQGGGFTQSFEQKPTQGAILNEANNQQPNVRGSLAMARRANPHSATSQFFINLVDNPGLNYRSSTPQGWGYCVFGRVIAGMSVVDKIGKMPTRAMGPFPADYPIQPVIILKTEILTNS